VAVGFWEVSVLLLCVVQKQHTHARTETSSPLGWWLGDVSVTGTSLPAKRAAADAAAAGPVCPHDCHRQAPFPTAYHRNLVAQRGIQAGVAVHFGASLNI
jgi:hypothetical protein